MDITVKDAREHLRLETLDDDTAVDFALQDAKQVVNTYLSPRKIDDLSENEAPIARRAVLYTLYQFYYERVPKNSKDLHEYLVWMLQPIRKLTV